MRSRKSRSWLTRMHRAGIVGDHLLQEVERLEVEVVGRLVEHQQVRGRGERAGEHEAAALAAGERADRLAGLLRREQKILHVADDVARLRRRPSRCRRRSRVSASFSVVAGSRLARRWSSEAISRLAPSRTVPPSGAAAPVRMSSSVVLPAPFGPTMPSRSPRAMRSERSRIERPAAERLGDALRLDDQLAGGLRRRRR